MSMRITEGKGFQMDLPNGVTVSVQFGPGNYCDKQHQAFDAPRVAIENNEHWEANRAECAAYVTGSHCDWVAVPGFTGRHTDADDAFYDDVCGWLDPQGVLDFINAAAKCKPQEARHNPIPSHLI